MSLEFDIRRSIFLSRYIEEWGMPDSRRVMSKKDNLVELYTFSSEKIQRYATIGLSSCKTTAGIECTNELFLAVPSYIVDEQAEIIENYIFDISAYLLCRLGRNAESGMAIPESPIAPKGWPSAILFDEPYGESEELACFHVGAQHVNLLWVMPIHSSEYELIKAEGLERFDKAIQTADLSVVDVGRESCV
ncbi:suppressor of fused domain protein [Microbulbifer sp. PAAF003]|uniref:suppressor of fused domain protein n=1 Tax=Microbulbifer sp. PAAF003 TaxID=3243375 RepID=UPI00403943F6